MPNLLIFTNYLRNGGAQRVAARLANALSEKYDVYMLLVENEVKYPLSDRVNVIELEPNVRTITYWTRKNVLKLRINRFLFFSRLCLRLRPVATLSFLNKQDWLNLFGIGGGKRILSERNNPRMKDPGYFREDCIKFFLADRVVFQSETVRQMFPRWIRRKGIVIPNPVDIACQAAYAGGKRIVSAGRLHPQKNQALMLRAFARFAANHPDYTLHLYGDGELQKELPRLAEELHIADKVFIEPFRADLHEAIRDARMFVLSSDYEGMPNALLEAMMMGLPCITTRFPGAEEILGTGACLMTPVGDEAALAAAMAALADDDPYREALASAGEAYAQRFSIDRVIPLWEQIL